MQILGLLASPRRLGNCELLVKEISLQMAAEHELKLLRLPDFRIEPCRACYSCLFGEMRCTTEDDLPIILEALIGCDALIVASPTYFLAPNASLKRLLDRGLSFYSQGERLWGKPALGLAVAGIPGKEGYTLLGVESFLKCLLADIKASAVLYGALPGEVFLGEENRQRAGELAGRLLSAGAGPAQSFCPVCGGDTFRFLDQRRVRCMLCSNEGTMETGPEGPRFRIRQSEHELFLSWQKAKEHLAWLQGMKQRFRDNKRELLQVMARYKDYGEWIEPG
jgi:multimeric flavodoxin WrbA